MMLGGGWHTGPQADSVRISSAMCKSNSVSEIHKFAYSCGPVRQENISAFPPASCDRRPALPGMSCENGNRNEIRSALRGERLIGMI